MAITAGICNSYKQELLSGIHLAAHTYKIALFASAATLGPTTTAYAATNEVSGAGYTAGGATLAGFTPGANGATVWLDWTTDPSWPAATITARGALIYNDTLAGKNAVAVLDFSTDKVSTNGTFTIQFPTPDAANALIRIS
jgi:hypothetical protein